jgi:hypothetical protein
MFNCKIQGEVVVVEGNSKFNLHIQGEAAEAAVGEDSKFSFHIQEVVAEAAVGEDSKFSFHIQEVVAEAAAGEDSKFNLHILGEVAYSMFKFILYLLYFRIGFLLSEGL